MLKCLTEKGLYKTWNLSSFKDKATGLKGPLKWRAQNNVRMVVLKFLSCLETLNRISYTCFSPIGERRASIYMGLCTTFLIVKGLSQSFMPVVFNNYSAASFFVDKPWRIKRRSFSLSCIFYKRFIKISETFSLYH